MSVTAGVLVVSWLEPRDPTAVPPPCSRVRLRCPPRIWSELPEEQRQADPEPTWWNQGWPPPPEGRRCKAALFNGTRCWGRNDTPCAADGWCANHARSAGIILHRPAPVAAAPALDDRRRARLRLRCAACGRPVFCAVERLVEDYSGSAYGRVPRYVTHARCWDGPWRVPLPTGCYRVLPLPTLDELEGAAEESAMDDLSLNSGSDDE